MDSTSSPPRKPPAKGISSKSGEGDQVIDSLKDIVEINVCGAYCRMPRCRFVQPVYSNKGFIEHFRKEHPEEGQRRGLRKNVDLSSQLATIGRRLLRLKHPREAGSGKLGQGKMLKKSGQGLVQKYAAQRTDHHTKDDESQVEPKEKMSSTRADPPKQQEENLTQTTPSTDPTTFCRLCFSVTTPLKPIFNGPQDDDDTNLADLIEACTGVWLVADEDCHASICEACSQRLSEMQSFRQQCQRLDRIVVGEREEAKCGGEMGIEEVLVDGGESTEYLVEMIKPEGAVDCASARSARSSA